MPRFFFHFVCKNCSFRLIKERNSRTSALNGVVSPVMV